MSREKVNSLIFVRANRIIWKRALLMLYSRQKCFEGTFDSRAGTSGSSSTVSVKIVIFRRQLSGLAQHNEWSSSPSPCLSLVLVVSRWYLRHYHNSLRSALGWHSSSLTLDSSLCCCVNNVNKVGHPGCPLQVWLTLVSNWPIEWLSKVSGVSATEGTEVCFISWLAGWSQLVAAAWALYAITCETSADCSPSIQARARQAEVWGWNYYDSLLIWSIH